MGHYKENPRYKCVSTRLTDEEWEELQHVCDRSHKNLSECLREAILALFPRQDLNGDGAETSGVPCA